MTDHGTGKRPAEDIGEVLGLANSGTSTFWRRRRWPILAVAAIAAAAVFYTQFMSNGGDGATRFVTEPVGRGDLTVIVTATGKVQPTNEVDISSELSGTVREVLVDFNDKVMVDQVLAKLDTDKLKASAESARAKLAAAEARVKNAEATLVEHELQHNRKRVLVERKVGTVHDLEAAKAAHERAIASLESARADVVAAAADLKLHETNLAKTCICSPINGVVLKRNVDPGQTVASSLQAPVLFTIAEDLTKMEVRVDVDEADVGKVKEGQKATFGVDAYSDRTFEAVIRQLRFGSEIVQDVVTYKAILIADNSDLLLRPGMTATAEIIVQTVTDAVTVPNAALRFQPRSDTARTDDRSFLRKLLPGRPRLRPASRRTPSGAARSVWVLEGGEVSKVDVVIGATDGRRTEIVKGGIEPGQAVIVDTAPATK